MERGYVSKLNHKQIIEYFNRSYKAVDGLWFMKVEERYGFDTALKLDDEVWKVMPKIQARLVKSFLNLKDGPDSLFDGLITKLELEGFKYKAEKTQNGFQISIADCPWYTLMIKSGREHLAGTVGNIICTTEYQVWASELAKNMKFKFKTKKCHKSKKCTLVFLNK